jgi:solute carrier family 12 sodium/potassium/chloride transporter 2
MKQYGNISGITAIRLNDIRIIATLGLVAILILVLIGMAWITRVQIGLLALLIVSQIDFIVGTFLEPNDELRAKGFIGYNGTLMESNFWAQYTFNEEAGQQHNFFSVFAVFFPAVTGIVAGANVSGDLKDPSDAIPKGTLLAIAVTAASYLSYGVLVAGCSLRYASGVIEEVWFADGTLNETLREELNITKTFDDCEGRKCDYGLVESQQMMEVMSAWGPMIYAGCFAATLSSAIGSLEGAPRVFQAISKDKLLPGLYFFAKGHGVNNDPIRGYVLVSIIAQICILIGNLNVVSYNSFSINRFQETKYYHTVIMSAYWKSLSIL